MTIRGLMSRLRRLEAQQPDARRVWVVKLDDGQDKEVALAAVIDGRTCRDDDAVVYHGPGGGDWLAALERNPGLIDRIYANDGGGRRWASAILAMVAACPLSRIESYIRP